MAKSKPEEKEQGTIKQGSVAEFFRKRTQLVGFDFGLHKHTQYAVEFLDNSLDAIESFQWKMGKQHPEYTFILKDDLLLENLSYYKAVTLEDIDRLQQKLEDEKVDDEGFELAEDGTIKFSKSEEDEDQLILEEEKEIEDSAPTSLEDDEEARQLRKLQKKEDEVEEEVQKIIQHLDDFIHPVEPLVEREPFVIIRIQESEAQEVYADINQKSAKAYEYHLEIFDNGTGMSPIDLEKFGKYLASSKSQKLKQTRGSQGFGSPSAFSDAQNTTGKPITVVSKDIHHIYGMCSEFYTTSKNNKEYMIPPTEISTPFEHGTYISLNYLNVKYRRGFIDDYIKLTALTNPHINLIYIDPYGEENVYPRRVDRFPREPTYALPHPSSVNIGDFQDKLRISENLTLSAFFQDNFVRMSSSLAKKILFESEQKLERILDIIDIDGGYLKWLKKKGNPVYYARNEERVFGRSKRKRSKLVVYEINKSSDIQAYWDVIEPFNQIYSKLDSLYKKSRKIKEKLLEEATKKGRREVKKELRDNEKEIEKIENEIEKARSHISKIAKTFEINESNEITDVKITDNLEDDIKELKISESRPNSLTQRQTEALFKRFKAQKYLAPPSEPAVPIGASVLETTMLKEYNLNPSHRTDLFLDYEEKIEPLSQDEASYYPNRILAKFKRPPYLDSEFSNKDLFFSSDSFDVEHYNEFFQKFDVLYLHEEDFVEGKTRKPTSGKGLAFVVEAVIAISPKISAANTANQVLKRYVNRTPKLRDNSDCAIWKGVQSVNWKNYKIDTFDNGIPKGNIRILVNISGPYVHLMFKSQSKNALAEDEILLKEIKMCLEAIGRKIRRFKNKKLRREKRRKRSKVIEKYIPIFVGSLMEIANKNPEYSKIKSADLEEIIKSKLNEEPEKLAEVQKSIKEKLPFTIKVNKIEESTSSLQKELKPLQTEEKTIGNKQKISEQANLKEERSLTALKSTKHLDSKSEKPLSVGSKGEKQLSIKFKKPETTSVSDSKKISIKKDLSKQQTLDVSKPKSITPKNASSVSDVSLSPREIIKHTKKKLDDLKAGQQRQAKREAESKPLEDDSKKSNKLKKPESKLTLISSKAILGVLEEDKWYNIKQIIKRLHITDIKDARYLQLKLKQLTREKKILISLKSGKTYYKRK